MRLMKLLERRKIHEKETEGSKADACGDTVSVLYCGTFSVLYSFCGNQINLSCHWIRTGGGVEFFFDRDGRSSDLHLLFRKTFLWICVCVRIFRRCRVRRLFLDLDEMFIKKRNQPFLKSWSTDFRKSNISYWP